MMVMTRWCERRALSDAAFVFALSDYSLRALRGRGAAPERSAVAVCGVDTDRFRPDQESPGRYILSVARFSDPRKNLGLLLQAYAELVRTDNSGSCPDLHLAGPPPPPTVGRDLADLGIADRVHILGQLSPEALALEYRRAMMFVLPSDEEGLGIVILEAMASGIAVVSTRSGGPEMIVEDGTTGLLTPIGDPAALAEAMRTLVRNPPARSRMGAAARQVAVERYSNAARVAPFIDVYDRILGTSPLVGRRDPGQTRPGAE